MSDGAPSSVQAEPKDRFLGRRAGSWLRRRWRLAAFLAGLAVLILALVLTSARPPRPTFETAEVRRQTLVLSVSATGNLKATRQVEVGSETSGLVDAVYVDTNDRVSRGQVLARLDTARLEDSLRQAEASLAQAEAQVRVNEATERESADLLRRREAAAQASGGRTPSERELEQARLDLARAQAQTRSAQAQVAQARAQLSSARTDLRRASIVSPVSGTVLARSVEPGQTVAAAFQTPVLFIIAEDLSQMILDVEVDEADIGQVEAGQSASFTVDAFPGERFPAVVERVDVGASNLTSDTAGASSVVYYLARLGVRNPEGRLRPGMTATSTIVTQRLENNLTAPIAALRFQPPQDSGPRRLTFSPPNVDAPRNQQATIGRGSEQTVHVLQPDGALRAIRVEVVAVSGTVAAVRGEGLSPGQRVAVGLGAAP